MQAVFEFERCQVAKGRVEPLGIIEGFDVIKEHGLGFGTVTRGPILETLGFKRSKEAFHRRVIVAASLAAHAGLDLMGLKHLPEA
jgi:hypothetical protein